MKVIICEHHPNDNRIKIDSSGTIQTLTSRMGTGGGNVPIVIFIKSRRAQNAEDYETWKTSEVANTLNTFDGGDVRATTLIVNENEMPDPYNNNFYVRRLTPLECERLQGFPDGWTNIGEWIDSKGKKRKTADSARYKAL